jgi:DNA transposition AAA+ family ATPase
MEQQTILKEVKGAPTLRDDHNRRDQMEGQVLEEAVRDDSPEGLTHRLRRYMTETKMSQPKTARAVGVSDATISQVLSGKYPKLEESGVLAKIKAFLDLERPPWQIVETVNLRKIERLCAFARNRGEFCVVVGRAGFGKTQGLLYARRRKGCFYVRVNGGSTPKILLKQILRAIGADWSHGPVADLLGAVIGHLQRRQDALLLIDEADRLTIKSLELIRDVYDATECGIVLSGLHRLENIMVKGASLKENLEQLYSRVSAILRLEPITDDECDAIVGQFKVKEQRAKEYIRQRIAIDGMRKLSKIIVNAQEIARKNGHRGAITLDILKKAEEYLMF